MYCIVQVASIKAAHAERLRAEAAAREAEAAAEAAAAAKKKGAAVKKPDATKTEPTPAAETPAEPELPPRPATEALGASFLQGLPSLAPGWCGHVSLHPLSASIKSRKFLQSMFLSLGCSLEVMQRGASR
jgi:hypothetical protein